MNYPKGMFQPEAKAAITDWRTALDEMKPKTPFDQDKRDAAKTIIKDERIANDLFMQRHAAHLQEGVDDVTARKLAAQDLTDFARRFGGK